MVVVVEKGDDREGDGSGHVDTGWFARMTSDQLEEPEISRRRRGKFARRVLEGRVHVFGLQPGVKSETQITPPKLPVSALSSVLSQEPALLPEE